MLTQSARKVDVFEHVDELHRQQQARLKRKTMENRSVRKDREEVRKNEPRLRPGFLGVGFLEINERLAYGRLRPEADGQAHGQKALDEMNPPTCTAFRTGSVKRNISNIFIR